jgi:hypothetical protein
MARFGQSFIQSLINPSYQKGLFTAAQQIGSAPARRREAEEEQTFQKNLFDLQRQGIAASSQEAADPAALRKRINQLTEMASSASDPARAAAARKSALALQERMNQTNQFVNQRTAKQSVELARAIDSGQFDNNPQLKAQLEQRLASLRNDPAARPGLEQYGRQKTMAVINQELTALADPTLNPEKIAQLTNSIYNKARMNGIDEGQIRTSITQVNNQRRSQLKTEGALKLDALLVQMLQSQDPAEMDMLEAQMVEMAPTYGLPANSYVGRARSVRMDRDKAEAAAEAARAEQELKAQAELAEQIASQVRTGQLAEIPSNIDDETATMAKDIIVERENKDNDFAEIIEGQTISQEYIDKATEYAETFKDAFLTTEIRDALTVLSNPAQTSSALRTKAVNTVRKAVDGFDKERKDALTSDAVLGRKADIVLQTISRQGDYTWFEKSVRDVLMDDENEQVINKLKKNIMQVFREKPNLLQDPESNLETILNLALEGMEDQFRGQKTQSKGAREEAESQTEIQLAINKIYEDNLNSNLNWIIDNYKKRNGVTLSREEAMQKFEPQLRQKAEEQYNRAINNENFSFVRSR